MEPFESRSTDRLLLRRPTAEDVDAILDYWSDPEVHRFLQHPVSEDLAEIRNFVLALQSKWANGESFAWGIVELATGRFVGMIEARISPHGIELGYVLNRNVWGQGYMTEAVRTVIEWGLSQPDIHRVWAYVHVGNTASQKLLEKAGMVKEGTLHRWGPRAGQTPVDSFMYACWIE
jgi:ribosomal-protein-alanine N-acetyltransferase